MLKGQLWKYKLGAIAAGCHGCEQTEVYCRTVSVMSLWVEW